MHQAGRRADAEALCRRVLEQRADDVGALHLLGLIAWETGRHDAAVHLMTRALGGAPDDVQLLLDLGTAQFAAGDAPGAEVRFRAAVERAPDHAMAHYNLATVLHGSAPDAAIDSYRCALACEPALAIATHNLATLLKLEDRLPEADEVVKRAAAAEPMAGEWQLRRLPLQVPALLDRAEDADAIRSRIREQLATLAAEPRSVRMLDHAAIDFFPLAYHGRDDRQLLESVAMAMRRSAPVLDSLPPPIRSASRAGPRLRIGFVSSLFHEHTIAKLNEGYIARLDRQRFEVVVLHTPGGFNDARRQRINAAADRVVHLPMQLEAAARRIHALELDALHFTDVGMSSYSWLLPFFRMAPVQTVSWGHPLTTGLDTVDYFLSFDAAEPDGAEAHYTESLIRLRRIPSWYEAPATLAPASRADFDLPAGGRLYGCVQTLFKFHPDFDPVLARIVALDPGASVVCLEAFRPALQRQLEARWRHRYPDLAARVRFLPTLPQERFARLLGLVDVLLDTPHFGSGNTLFEALAVGTPIVTWPGAFMRGRLVAGVYRWLGLNESVVASQLGDYADTAVGLAGDRARRGLWREALMERRASLYRDDLAVEEFAMFMQAAVAAAHEGRRLSGFASKLPVPAGGSSA